MRPLGKVALLATCAAVTAGAAFALEDPKTAAALLELHRGGLERARRFPLPVLSAPERRSLALGERPVLRLHARAEVLDELPLPDGSSQVVAIADRGDQVAIGTFDTGLFLYDRASDELRKLEVDEWINALAWGEDGTLYVASGSGAFAVQPDGEVIRLSTTAAMGVALWRGEAWFAGPRGLLAVRDGGVLLLGAEQGLELGRPSSLATCGADLCVGSPEGVWRFDGTRAEKWSSARGQLPTDDVTALAQGADGEVWVGTFDGGVARVGEQGRRFTVSGGLADGRVLPGALTTLGSTAFGGTPSGLLVLRGDGAKVIDLDQREVTAVARDSQGMVWVGFRGAVARLALIEEERS